MLRLDSFRLPWARSNAQRGARATGVRRLRVAGGQIVDEHRSPYVLRGVSLFWSEMQDRFHNDEAVRWLVRDWRISVIRVPIGVADAASARAWRDTIDLTRRVIESAIRHDIHVIADWHSHARFTDEAAQCLGFIAQTYGDVPNILYEPWNEPAPGFTWDEIAAHHEAVASQIRRAAPSAVLLAGTPDFCQGVDAVIGHALTCGNVAYCLHFYAGTHREGLRERARRAVVAGVPLFVSEWGAGEADGDGTLDPAETARWLAFLDEHRIGSVNWSITDKQETCAALRPTAASDGGWSTGRLTESGRLVRAFLRAQGRQVR